MTEMRTAPVRDGHLAYLDTGSGDSCDTVVLLHGGVLDHRMWSRQIDAFAEHHRVVAPDARGHGDSSTPTTPFRHCDDLADLLHHLDTGPVTPVGLSMGAGNAVDTAVEYPDLVTRLVITGTGTSDPDWRDPWTLDLLATWARQAEDHDAAGWLETFLRLGNGPHRSLDDVNPQVVADLREQAQKTLTVHIGDRTPILPGPVADIRHRARLISVPVLALPGGLDSDDHIRMARELADAVAHGTWATIDGTAHYPNMEHPDEFNRLTLAFLAAGRSAAARQ